jgi:co-chaperonin GroES (HSP10)
MTVINKSIRPIHDSVLIHNMHFGEQTSSGGLIILGDDGKDRGIYPRWGQVYAKGPTNTEDYQVGDWILIEHGRWTRGIDIGPSEEEKTTIRMVDKECILMWSTEKPNDVYIAHTLTATVPNEAYRI